ncbi:MAG: YceI family protein [Cruoricaptor ignavus]|nr:YceI family protein [Cruoricaptor ignavus]
MKKITSALVLAFGLFATTISAQSISQKSASITVDGTSSLHDWTMSASSATFSGTVSGNAINSVKFTMPAKNLKSKKGKMMDNKAYNALNADKAPNITFTANSINVGKGNATGQLSIAGTTKNVTFPIAVSKNGNTYTISGNTTVKMSDYGMKTPGFMGVKTGDAVTIKVNVVAE